VTNRSEHPQKLAVSAEGPAGLVVDAQPITVDAAGAAQVVVRLRLPAEAAAPLAGQSVPIAFVLSEAAHDGHPALSRREKSTFLVPR
jgi:hypothetical protein